MIANEEGKNFGSIDQNVEVIDQGFAVEKIVRRNQKIPASLKTFFSHYEKVESPLYVSADPFQLNLATLRPKRFSSLC